MKFLLVFGAFWSASPAGAQDDLQSVSLEVRGPGRTVSPGESFPVTVHFQIEEPWHIYWANPGTSGLPTRLEWNLPKGFQLTNVLWPSPQKFVTPDGVFFGYSGQMQVNALVVAPKSFGSAREVSLGVEARWLACDTQCVPGKDYSSTQIRLETAAPQVLPRPELSQGIPSPGNDKGKSAPSSTPGAHPSRFPVNPAVVGVALTATPSAALVKNQPRQLSLWVKIPAAHQRDWERLHPYFFPGTPGVFQLQAQQKVVTMPGGFFIVLPLESSAQLPKEVRGVLVFSSKENRPDVLPPVVVQTRVAVGAKPVAVAVRSAKPSVK